MTPRHPHKPLPIALLFGVFLVLILVVLIATGNVQALTLDSDDMPQTSVSNSSMTFNTVNVYVDQVTIENISIHIFNASYVINGSTMNLSGVMNWTAANTNLDSAQFPRAHVSSSELIHIFNNASTTVLGAFTIPFSSIACASIDYIRFVSQTGATDFNPGVTCASSTLTFPSITGIEPGINRLIINPVTSGGTGGTGGTGGGGGGGGGTGNDTNISITGGAGIGFLNFTVETDSTWHLGSEETITIKVLNTSNHGYDPQFVTVRFARTDIEHDTVRKKVGEYQTTVENITGAAGSTISFNVTVEDFGSSLSKSYTVRLQEQSTTGEIVERVENWFEGLLVLIIRYWIPLAVIVGILLAILFFFLLAGRDKDDERRQPVYPAEFRQ